MMTKTRISVTFSAVLLAVSSFAQSNESTTAALEIIEVCNYVPVWNDKGSGGTDDFSMYAPKIPKGFYMLGDYAQGDYRDPAQCVTAVKPASDKNAALLAKPSSWQAVWLDKGTGADRDGSIWRAISSDPDYVCIGHVGQRGYSQPNPSNYRCLHSCLVEKVKLTSAIWTDRGTGARHPVSVYKLLNSKGFYAQSDHRNPGSVFDIKKNPICNQAIPAKEDIIDEAPSTSDWKNPDEPVQKPVNKPAKKTVSPAPSSRPRTNREWINPDQVN